MTNQLTLTEIQEIQQILKDYNPSQPALTILTKNQGKLDASFDELWQEQNGTQMFIQGKSLWKVMLGEIRKEICGDDGFRGKIKEYTNNPASAPLLTGLIVSVSSIAVAHGLPIDPAIATIIVLYVVKIGLNTFCEYTQPETNPQLPGAAEEKRK